jgi:hypothetical protein
VTPPRIVRTLQRLRIILSPERHRTHHTAPFESSYAITNGWLNLLLNRTRFFRRLERVLCAFGVRASKGQGEVTDLTNEPLNYRVLPVFAPLLLLTGAAGFVLPADKALMSGAPAYNIFHLAAGLFSIGLLIFKSGRAAGTLQREKLLLYARGRGTALDRGGWSGTRPTRPNRITTNRLPYPCRSSSAS